MASSEDGLRRLLLLLAVVCVSLFAVWAISPRFELDTPSVVDDWSALFYSPDLVSDVVRLTNPETERFRPGVIVWTYFQWHTFDAPQGLIGPNLWNILRVVVLVAGLSLFTALALPVRRGRLEAVLYAGLASIPALLVVVVPKFARDLARFGPQEPLLVGGMALGGSLLLLAGRSLLAESRPVHRWRVLALAVGGAVAWVMGTYQKETSVCVLPLLVAVLITVWPRLAGWRRLSVGRKYALAALGAVVVVPLAHVAIETLRIVRRGDLVYDAEAGGGIVSGTRDLYEWAHEALPEQTRLLMYLAVVLTIVATVVRRRVDPIAIGALLSGALSFAFAGQSGVLATRYYIPLVALFSVALVLSLARLPAPIQAAGGLAILFAFFPPSSTRDEVQAWTNEELGNGAIVREVGALDGSGCRVAVAGLDIETSLALPVLAGLERRDDGRTCRGGETYFVVGGGIEGANLQSACAAGSLERLREALMGALLRCSRLRADPVRVPSGALVDPRQLVARHRLEPARFD